MKTIKTFIGIMTVIFASSCNNSEKTPEETTPPPTTTIEKTTTIHTETNTGAKDDGDHTEIGIDPNGVKYSKKSGTNQTDVKIKTDSSSLIIRKKK